MTQDQIVAGLLEALKTEFTGYVDDVLKSVGFLLLALGWLLTSDTARNALRPRRSNAIASIFTGIITLNLALLLYAHYHRSQQIQAALKSRVPEASDLIDRYVIGLGQVAVNALALGGLIGLIFLALRNAASQPPVAAGELGAKQEDTNPAGGGKD